MTRVYLDATPLIALGTIGELETLTTHEGALVVLPQIHDEVTTEPARTNLERFLTAHDVSTATNTPETHLDSAKTMLGDPQETGDIHLIAAVLDHTEANRPVVVVSDDRRIRTSARGLGARVTGTIGVIVRATNAGLPPDAAHTIVDRLAENGLHMTAALKERAHELIGEANSGPDDPE